MLPQKFSAAVKSIRVPGPPVEDSAERPHPTAARAMTRASARTMLGAGLPVRCALGAGKAAETNTE